MRRAITIVTLCMLVGLYSIPGWADSPHYLKAAASFDAGTACYSVALKEAGLGNSGSGPTQITYALTCTATFTASCFNNGGNHPKAGNKTTVNGPVTGGGNFQVRNGSVTGTATVSLPGPGTFSCPSGQTLVLLSGTYENITITDNTESDGPVSTTPDFIAVP